MPNLLQLIKQYRKRVSDRENTAVSNIETIYRAIFQNLVTEFTELTTVIEGLQAGGKRVSKTQLYQSTRLASIITQVTEELHNFADTASSEITEAQEDVVNFAIQDSVNLIRSSMGKIPKTIDFDQAFLNFDDYAAKQMVARFADGSPVREAMESYVGNLIGQVEIAFVQGIVKGLPARAVTQQLYKTFGLSFVNAQTSARTNIISAYRDANLERYSQSKAVKGWVWSATLDERTCPVCIYMDGQVFDLDTPFATHPVCRCSPLPVTFTWRELGIDIDDNKPDLGPRGEDWFKAQSDETQLAILKRDKFKLYKSGQISLKDLTNFFDHPKYGPSREERSILDLKRLRILN